MGQRDTRSDDLRILRRCIRDIVALSALPAVWSSYDMPRIAESLADVLLGMLHLDFIYVRVQLHGSDAPLEIARTEEGLPMDGQAQLLRRALTPWLDGPGASLPSRIANPVGSEMVRIVNTPIGLGAEHGVVIAASQRVDFATEAESLLLTVGANQAAMLFGRLRVETAIQQANAELEQRVQERTMALHRAMAEHQRLEGEAQRAQHFALLGRLAAGVSHEIRNPLGTIVLLMDLLEEELQHPSTDSASHIAEALIDIKTNLTRLDNLVQDYLSLARVAVIQRHPVDLPTLVRQFAQEMTPALTAQGITLHLDTLDQLGTVALHPNTFRRALLNLVHNAMDAMPRGGTLRLRGRRQAATVQLDISDTGSGIPAEQQALIFEPLHTTKPGGTGLGLYIVQEVVEAHGGQVAVHSTVGHGTTFTITLPLAEK
jgi:signal transduction histidine kinase